MTFTVVTTAHGEIRLISAERLPLGAGHGCYGIDNTMRDTRIGVTLEQLHQMIGQQIAAERRVQSRSASQRR